LQLGVISEAMDMAIILVAMITVTLAPVIFVRLVPESMESARKSVVVIGAGELGLQVAAELKAHHEPVVLFDANLENIQRAQRQGYLALAVDMQSPDGAFDKYLERARALVCTHQDARESFNICRNARALYGLERVITIVADPTIVPQFEQEGVFPVVLGHERARLLTLLARNPAVYELLTRTDDDKEIWEVTVRNTHIAGRAIQNLYLPGDVLILTVRRDGELLIPHGNTRLNWGDQITLVGSVDFMDTAQQVFH
jgi:trk system potassium uptake protein TrkA